MTTATRAWLRTHSFDHRAFSAARVAAERTRTVSICVPARNEERTIGPTLERLLSLVEQGVADQVLVVDGSSDETPEIARRIGAEVHDQDALAPEFGETLGKGDAMWRALPLLRGDIVCFVDADSSDFDVHFVLGLIGPLLKDPELGFMKGFYRRPFRAGETVMPTGGGRVTELTARPLLNLFYPELAVIRQPLAGEMAGRRDIFEQLPFTTGYGVEIGLLLDAYAALGLAGIAQVDLDVRQNAHQSLRDLGGMSFAVLRAVATRLEREGRLHGPLPDTFLHPETDPPAELAVRLAERPPVSQLRAAA